MKWYTPILLTTATLALTAALAPLPALTAAQEPEPESAGKGKREREVLIGEITTGTEAGLELRPWNPRLPRRVNVETGPETRYLRQKRGKWSDLKVGDAVLVMPIIPKPPTPPQPDPDEATPTAADAQKEKEEEALEAQEPARRPSVRALLRLWPAGDALPTQEDTKTARALLKAADPYFKVKELGGVGLPQDHEKPVVGILTALTPITIRTERRTRRFAVRKEVLIVTHEPVAREEMKRGRTVLVQSDEKASLEETVPASLVALCQERKLPPRQMRQFLLREERKTDPSPKKR
ncbi:MAG: hypothetical protein ACK47B_15025 [Armatimonadota bacterium]